MESNTETVRRLSAERYGRLEALESERRGSQGTEAASLDPEVEGALAAIEAGLAAGIIAVDTGPLAAWRAESACVGAMADMGATSGPAATRALLRCYCCPVWRECLIWAVRQGTEFRGVAGRRVWRDTRTRRRSNKRPATQNTGAA